MHQSNIRKHHTRLGVGCWVGRQGTNFSLVGRRRVARPTLASDPPRKRQTNREKSQTRNSHPTRPGVTYAARHPPRICRKLFGFGPPRLPHNFPNQIFLPLLRCPKCAMHIDHCLIHSSWNKQQQQQLWHWDRRSIWNKIARTHLFFRSGSWFQKLLSRRCVWDRFQAC